MRTETYLICEKCGNPIYNEASGVIVQGNIYTAKLNKDGKPEGGLIGNNFPSHREPFTSNFPKEGKFSVEEINMVAFHHECIREILRPTEKIRTRARSTEV